MPSGSRDRLDVVNPAVAVVQMTCTPNVEENFHQGRMLIERAVKRGAQVF